MVTVDYCSTAEMPLHNWQQCCCCTVGNDAHGLHRTSQTPTLHFWGHAHDGTAKDWINNLTVVTDLRTTYLGLVTKQRLVNLYRHTWPSKLQWCILVQKPPAAHIPAVLVGLDGCLPVHFSLLSSIGYRVLPSPPVK